MQKKLNIAIFSPFESATETFIKAHKSLPFNVKYFYGGFVPAFLEGQGSIKKGAHFKKAMKKIFNGKFDFSESQLIKYLKRNKIDCVLAEYGPTGVASLNVLKFLRIPLIVHFHGYDASQTDIINQYRKGYSRMFDYASKIIAVSNVMKESLINIGCPANKILVNPCGPQTISLNKASNYKTKSFISVGRFVDKKAPYYSILAFKIANKEHPGSTLTMIGDGPLLNACKNLSRYLNIGDKVIFTGSLGHEEVFDQMSKSFAFVQHSIVAENGDSEGTPVAILEAQAIGLPVISTRHAGIPEVVIDGKTGLLCAEHDIEAMSRNMVDLLNDPQYASQLGKNGKDHVRENFSLEKHLEILKETIITSVNSA